MGLVESAVLERVGGITLADDVASAVRDVDLVFEAVFERIDVKQVVFQAIEGAARADALIASNTSSLPIDDLARCSVRRSASWACTGSTHPFLQAIGKHPIVVGSGLGFVANRIQLTLFREALACVEDGLASPAKVDEVVRNCFGFRLPFFGPFQIADMAGLDVYRRLRDPRARPRRALPGAGDARRTRGPARLWDQNWRRLLQLHARGARAAVC
jgi:3-hydroxybutyryl-CoA dehydrogenase